MNRIFLDCKPITW